MGNGTAWGGRLSCTEKNSRVQIPNSPPKYKCYNLTLLNKGE